jgi:hypothetical protein
VIEKICFFFWRNTTDTKYNFKRERVLLLCYDLM